MTYKSKLIAVFIFAVIILPYAASAQVFEPLVGIPGVPNNSATFGDYLNALYALSISIAGLLAVVKIVIAGAKYMLSDVVTSKEDAKKDIKGALFGLLIVLAAALILIVINPQLIKNNIILSPVLVDDSPSLTTAQNIADIQFQCGQAGSGGCSPKPCTLTEADPCRDERTACSGPNQTSRIVTEQGGSTLYCFTEQPFLGNTVTAITDFLGITGSEAGVCKTASCDTDCPVDHFERCTRCRQNDQDVSVTRLFTIYKVSCTPKTPQP